MAHPESCQERQKNEFEVLKSIFGDELHDLRKNKNKKKWQPMDISITLTPQQGMSGPAEIYAKIDLCLTCNDKYPDTPPTIQLNNSLGLSNEQISCLSNELKILSKQLKGEVMIYDLAQHVQKFLHENNKPGTKSFYEEMVTRQKEKMQTEMQVMQEKKLQEDKERQLIQDEILKRREALQAELRERRESIQLSQTIQSLSLSPSTSSSSLLSERGQKTISRRRHRSSCVYLDDKICNHQGTELIKFDNNWGDRNVHRGRCLGHSSKGSNVYAGVDNTSGELLAITEWSLKCITNNDSSINDTSDLQYAIKQISSIEQELNYLQRLQHSNLVRYYNLKYIQENDEITIYIVQEFVVGTTCSFLLTENFPVTPEMLRHITTGVLSALEFLHNNNIVHKDLRDTSIHIDRQGIIKVSDYSLNKRLSDIYHSNCLAKNDHDFPTIQGRGGKKLDIYRFGIILLSLLKGKIITEIDTDWDKNIVQSEIRDFLSKCLTNDERSRWSANQLQTHIFIRTPIIHGISKPKKNHDNENNSTESEEQANDMSMYLTLLGGQSRIQNEFEGLKWLGKGAFGDVIKARNKLDGGIYAIKRIRLDAKTKQLNKKITREVKLLSRLNHENVVRYYHSWIECATMDDTNTNESSTSASQTSDEQSVDNNDDDDDDDNENDASSDEDSDEDWDLLRRTANESSDFVEFEKDDDDDEEEEDDDDEEDDDEDDESKTINKTNNGNNIKKKIQFMCIQMEFCEKSTLRTAIDNFLYKDEERLWRLFREIIEGLAHIHQQGMIHRDLKPVNIFLDSNDHVKIGDFGLATTNIFSSSLTQSSTNDNDNNNNMSDKLLVTSDTDKCNSMTGQIGTALYVAPELNSKTSKSMYNQKVDIYSLGIILFEMCYKPMDTGMERIKTLMNIRMKEIILPDDINQGDTNKKLKLLNLLLNHDPSQRPTSQELLTSEYLPPPLEEAELQEMIGHTLSNSQSKAYKYLICSCFDQNVTPAEDITYDMIIPQTKSTLNNKNTIACCCDSSFGYVRSYVKSKVIEIFQCHGGIDITTSLLMPKSGHIYNDTDTCVKLMTHSGYIVTLPHDLRAPFARYVAWNSIKHHRRYTIEKVYREQKVHGIHPRELFECAFDIVSPTKSLMAESELIYIVWKIFDNLPELYNKTFTVRLNHTSLLQGVLMYCDIESDKYQDIYMILRDARSGRISKFQVQTHLISLCLSDRAMALLFNLFDIESSAAKIISILKSIIKRKCDASEYVKYSLGEIETVISHAESFGVKFPIIIAPLLVPNITQYSGIFYQITCEPTKPRRRDGHNVIAAGGRYDKMLTTYHKLAEKTGLTNNTIEQHAVGISISFDKLVKIVSEAEKDCYDYTTKIDMKYGLNVAVSCTDGEPKRDHELANLLRELWTFGFRVTVLDLSTTQDVVNHAHENSITHIIILQSDEKSIFKLYTWERDHYNERKFSLNNIIEHFQKQIDNQLNRSDVKVTNNYDSSIMPINVNIRFLLPSTSKLSGSSRKSFKNSMLAQMTTHLQRISSKIPIEVFAVLIDMNVIWTIVKHLETDENEQKKNLQFIIEEHSRHKEYIQQICDEMIEARNEKSRPSLIMYSLIDNKFAIIL